jgi:hypothetical protein
MMDLEAVSAKFHANADPVLGEERSAALRETVLHLETSSARDLPRALSGSIA